MDLTVIARNDDRNLPPDFELRGQRIDTIEDAVRCLQEHERSEAYHLSTQLFDRLLADYTRMERNISVLYDYVNTEELWRGEEEHEDFQIRWREAQSIQARRVQNEEYVSANKQKAINAWGEEHANAFFGYLSTRSMVELTSKLITTGLSYEHIQLSINSEIVSRLTSPGRGIRNTKGIIQGDLTKALHRRCL